MHSFERKAMLFLIQIIFFMWSLIFLKKGLSLEQDVEILMRERKNLVLFESL